MTEHSDIQYFRYRDFRYQNTNVYITEPPKMSARQLDIRHLFVFSMFHIKTVNHNQLVAVVQVLYPNVDDA